MVLDRAATSAAPFSIFLLLSGLQSEGGELGGGWGVEQRDKKYIIHHVPYVYISKTFSYYSFLSSGEKYHTEFIWCSAE